MKNGDKTFLQKIKDNAFYLSLGIGLFAILAVVGVYTAQQNELKVAENEMDLNVASDYADLENYEGAKVAETNGDVTREEEIASTKEVVKEQDAEKTEDMADAEAAKEHEQSDETADAPSTANEQEASSEDGEAVPTAGDTGRLDFNSEKTITWPINGEVILPYSMETTVYYETLDQYKCNPGMLIQAGVGTTVQNAYLGQVTSVTSDNIYGNLVTLYIGNEYSIVYGQLDAVYVKEGDFVKAGQSIGTVGNPTDSFAKEGSHLFFQMKCGEETVDPMMYIE